MSALFWVGLFNEYVMQGNLPWLIIALGCINCWFGARERNDPDYLPCYAPKEMGENP